MITIWKLENDSWLLIEEVEESNLLSRLSELREDGSEYRAELRIESTSSILEA
jgi:hypothetical protein